MSKCSKKVNAMCSTALLLIMIVALPITAGYADQNEKAPSISNSSHEFNRLYECSRRVFNLTLFYPPPVDVRVLNNDLFFIFDGYKNELYIFSHSNLEVNAK